MEKYTCPYCGAMLNDQDGFDPSCGVWTCTECGHVSYGDDVERTQRKFPGLVWYCDSCDAVLSIQSGFSDDCETWVCTKCGHRNKITEDDIDDDGEDNGPECPNCGARLKDQFFYFDFNDDWECTECGAHLHRDYSFDPYEVVEDDGPECPSCGAKLKNQSCYSDYDDDWECTECGAQLHRDFSSDPYEVVDDDESDDDEDDEDEEDANDVNEDVYEHSGGYSHVPPNYTSSQSRRLGRSSHSRRSEASRAKEEKRIQERGLRKQRVKAFFFRHKKIQLQYNSSDLLGRNVDDVETLLHNQAFNNIKIVPIKDIYVGSPYSTGQVEHVVIQGNSHFGKGEQIPYDAEIVVTYHEKREITIPFSERMLWKTNYISAGDKFLDLGFTEIFMRPIHDLVTGWITKDGSVEKVTIGDVYPFGRNSVFAYDTKITIEYHTFKKK